MSDQTKIVVGIVLKTTIICAIIVAFFDDMSYPWYVWWALIMGF